MDATGRVQINDTGFYMVSFGVIQSAAATNQFWGLEVNGATQFHSVTNLSTNMTNRNYAAMTTIISITSVGSIVTVVNLGATANVQNTVAAQTGTNGAPAAYMTILKLR